MFNKNAYEKLEEITRLDKEVNPDKLIYRYKGPTEKFNAFDALNPLDKLKEGKTSLAEEKKWSDWI